MIYVKFYYIFYLKGKKDGAPIDSIKHMCLPYTC